VPLTARRPIASRFHDGQPDGFCIVALVKLYPPSRSSPGRQADEEPVRLLITCQNDPRVINQRVAIQIGAYVKRYRDLRAMRQPWTNVVAGTGESEPGRRYVLSGNGGYK
jgi:hypothetical protein